MRRPLQGSSLAAAAALSKGETFGEFVDYRGARVVAATRRIPETGWGIVRKIDRAEALADFYTRAWLEALAVLLLVVSAGILLRGHQRKTAVRILQQEVARQQALLELRAAVTDSERRLGALVERLDATVWEADANTHQFTFVSRRAEEILGYPVKEWLTAEDLLFDRIHPEDREKVSACLRDAATTEKDQTLTCRMLAAEGREVWLRNKFRGIRGVDGSIRELRGLMLDITERRRTEEALRESEAQNRFLADLLESSAQPFAVGYPDGRIGPVNQAFERLTGYTREELRTTTWGETLTPPEWREIERAKLEELQRTGQPVRYEKEYVRKDGSRVPIELLADLRKDEEGKPSFYYSFLTDLTEPKRTEAERTRLMAAIEQSAEAVVITDVKGTIQYVNPAFTWITGYGREEALGKNPRFLKSDKHDQEFYKNLWDTILKGKVWHGGMTNRRKDGSLYSEEMTITPVRDEHGQLSHFIAVKQDVSEQKKLEEQLRQAQKLEAIGQLAGGVAHDFNNLLTIIGGYSELTLERLSEPDPLRNYLEEIKKATERATSLTRQLPAFGRRQVLQPQVLNLNAVITNEDAPPPDRRGR